MICKCCLTGVSLAFALLAATPAHSEDAPASTTFTYTDDWSLVSAPPPPGPYSAIHIDPRVPGHDSLPPLPVSSQPLRSWEDVQEVTESTPPAAGTPAIVTQEQPLQQLSAPPHRPQSRMRPQQPAYNYPAPGHYPGRANYPGYGNRPPANYYQQPRQNQAEDVPPPPVYDAMMRRPGTAR